jgi:hypothetical protein
VGEVEGGQGEAGVVDGADARIGVEAMFERSALATWGTRQTSASVGDRRSRRARARARELRLEGAEALRDPVRYHRRAALVDPSRPRYFSTRRLSIGWMSQAIDCAMERTHARSSAPAGSSGGADASRRGTR